MKNSQKISEWFLRLGLAGTYLYSGYDLFMHPSAWHWAIRPLPEFIQGIINSFGIDQYLRIQGASELFFALLFLLWFLPRPIVRIVTLLAALEMASILLFVGIGGDTFRDIGLLGAALALAAIPSKENNRSSNVQNPSQK